MPWKQCSVMDERLQFVARRLAGEPMAELSALWYLPPSCTYSSVIASDSPSLRARFLRTISFDASFNASTSCGSSTSDTRMLSSTTVLFGSRVFRWG